MVFLRERNRFRRVEHIPCLFVEHWRCGYRRVLLPAESAMCPAPGAHPFAPGALSYPSCGPACDAALRVPDATLACGRLGTDTGLAGIAECLDQVGQHLAASVFDLEREQAIGAPGRGWSFYDCMGPGGRRPHHGHPSPPK